MANAMPLAKSRRALRPTKIFFDGGCRPNPGRMEIAVVVRGMIDIAHNIGHGTSFDAEWLALIHAAEIARNLGAGHFLLLGDAAAVVGQANGATKCRGIAMVYRARLMALIPAGCTVTVRHIKRTQNLAGIALARVHDT